MIKYPNSKRDIKHSILKDIVNVGSAKVGQRFFIGNNPITCVHIDGNKYIFSMDDIFKTTSYDRIEKVLETIWTTGIIDGINVIPINMMKDIDFLFIPTERQIFGKNEYSEKENDDQFEWFKCGEASRVKGYKGIKSGYWRYGGICDWWLCTVIPDNSTYCRYVDSTGNADTDHASNTNIGVPVFFQMTKER